MPSELLRSIYIHIPFCEHHCAYCDFNTYVERIGSLHSEQVVDAIATDIARTGEALASKKLARPQIETLFFGGGTPTFLSAAQITGLVESVRNYFPVAPDAEISSEANPGSSDAAKFASMRAAGFNRLSIGAQAFDDGLLKLLDRQHTAADAEAAFAAARGAGFANVSLDLMFRLPGQTRTAWRHSLERAVALAPEHLSLYSLTLEPGTRFERLYAGGKLALPGEDEDAFMYEDCIELLAASGYEQYEVSNFARPGFACRHNQIYWRNEPYLGFGPGAVSYLEGRRWKREKLPARYVKKVAAGDDLSVESESLCAESALGETIMLGLRMREGVSVAQLRTKYGVDPISIYRPQIEMLQRRGLLAYETQALRLTKQGLLLADEVAVEFVVA